jgi:hypothetical protein
VLLFTCIELIRCICATIHSLICLIYANILETAVERFQDSDSDATATGGRERRAVGQQQPPERNNNNNFNNNNNNGGAVGREEERRPARTTTLVRKVAVPPPYPFNNFLLSFKSLSVKWNVELLEQ